MEYDKKANAYDKFRKNCPGWTECLNLLDIKETDSILDLGCGTGVLTEKLLQLNPKEILGLDPSEQMLAKAKQKLSDPKIQLTQGFMCDAPKDKQYNIIFCAQVLQNISTNLDEVKGIRKSFYQEMYDRLLPGGQLLLTTRYFPKDEGYSVMYWYADKNLCPKAINHMNTVIGNVDEELKELCFENIQESISKDLIYEEKFYKLNQVDDADWRAADSFWSHVTRYNELDNVVQFMEKMEDKEKFIEGRDALRKNNGHILIVSATKPLSDSDEIVEKLKEATIA